MYICTTCNCMQYIIHPIMQPTATNEPWAMQIGAYIGYMHYTWHVMSYQVLLCQLQGSLQFMSLYFPTRSCTYSWHNEAWLVRGIGTTCYSQWQKWEVGMEIKKYEELEISMLYKIFSDLFFYVSGRLPSWLMNKITHHVCPKVRFAASHLRIVLLFWARVVTLCKPEHW